MNVYKPIFNYQTEYQNIKWISFFNEQLLGYLCESRLQTQAVKYHFFKFYIYMYIVVSVYLLFEYFDIRLQRFMIIT